MKKRKIVIIIGVACVMLLIFSLWHFHNNRKQGMQSAWYRSGVTVRVAQIYHPPGITDINLVFSHNVDEKRLFGFYNPLLVEKYINNRWVDVSGGLRLFDAFIPLFDIPSGYAKIVNFDLPPVLNEAGLYRITYFGTLFLAESFSWEALFTIPPIVGRGDDVIRLEFFVTE